jgi:hypothetical protein
MLGKRPENRANPSISWVERLASHHQTICGFYVTRSEKSFLGAEKAGFALSF